MRIRVRKLSMAELEDRMGLEWEECFGFTVDLDV